jgi:hypothetical protein
MNLREAHGWTYGARTSIYGDKRVSTFNASTQVRNAVTDSTVVEIFKEFKKNQQKSNRRNVSQRKSRLHWTICYAN